MSCREILNRIFNRRWKKIFANVLRKMIFTHRFDLIIGRYKLENSKKLLSFFSFLLSLFASSGGDRSRRPIFDSIHRESDGTIVI